MKKHTIVHPLLFGLFFVLALYSANVAEVSPSQVAVPALVVVGSTAFLVAVAWVVLRNLAKAALVASVLVVLCFSFGHVLNLTPKAAGAGYNFFTPTSGWAYLLFLLWGGVALATIYLIWRARSDLARLSSILSVVAVALVLIPTINIAVKEIGNSASKPRTEASVDIELIAPETPRDIYYLILDRYASETTLRDAYGFENGEFVQFLEQKGFYVAGESCANYFCTQHSLASSLNMDYLDDLAAIVGEESSDFGPIYHMMEDYRVWHCLSTVGYKFIHFGSWWEPTRENRYADLNVNYRGNLPEFSMLLLRTTALDPIGTTLELWGEPRRTHWERVRYKFEELAEIPAMEGPKFVFAHFLVPHPPYVFAADGTLAEPASLDETSDKGYRDSYIEQLVATNEMLMHLIDALLIGSKIPPIIILQADEGPLPQAGDWNVWRWDDASDSDLQEKVRILNAYYLPDTDQSVLYPSISPVNSFRMVFNLYFGADLDLLADRSYVYRRYRPYDLLDVTDAVRY